MPNTSSIFLLPISPEQATWIKWSRGLTEFTLNQLMILDLRLDVSEQDRSHRLSWERIDCARSLLIEPAGRQTDDCRHKNYNVAPPLFSCVLILQLF
jgi:hypothetical protein